MKPIHEFEKASRFDKTIVLKEKFKKRLADTYIEPQSYSRSVLYNNMAQGHTTVFTDYPMQLAQKYDETTQEALIRNLKEGLPKKERIYIRAGESRTKYKVTINDTIERWLRGRSRFGVTDLHFRGTNFYNKVDAEAISYFNLLCHCPESVSFLEMLTLVISSEGIFSDSHSDDGDGSNHCFVGKKLWLAWDRNEGRKRGLQDCTVDPVYDQAKFDMETFLSLKSAHWFIISDNRTLFMPGNFTHKVITLEPYIGYGSFYVTIPGYANTLKRWILHETGDVKGNFLEEMNQHSFRKMKQIAKGSSETRDKWGLNYLGHALRNWDKDLTTTQSKYLASHKTYGDFLNFVKAI